MPLLDMLCLVVIAPLLPLLAGAGLFMLTRSHLIAAGLSALGFGAWGALYVSRLSLDGPLSGALYGLGSYGVASGLVALAGSGYVRLIESEARRLGRERAAIVHAVGIALAVTDFVLFMITNGSDKVGNGLYLLILAWSLGAAAATGSFGGVVATMALVMVHGAWHLGRRHRQWCPRCRPGLYRDLHHAGVSGACSRDGRLWQVARRRPPGARKPWATRIGGPRGSGSPAGGKEPKRSRL